MRLSFILSIDPRYVLIFTGGLGVRNLTQFNSVLLGKLLWRFSTEREALCRVVVEAKYGSMWRGWCFNEVVGSFGVEVWKNIRRGWGVSLDSSSLRWEMGLRSSSSMICGVDTKH